MIAFTLLALVGFGPLVSGALSPASPCPQYFKYVGGRNESSMATLSIPVEVSELPVTVQVHLSLRIALKTTYVGIITLSENPTVVLGALLTGGASLINYTVRFPLPDPIPTLTKITLNNRTICTGMQIHISSVFGGVLTEILLEHTFPSKPFFSKDKLSVRDLPPHLVGAEQGGHQCGLERKFVSKVNEEIKEKESWPWLAAIFLVDDGDITFHCSGSLITRRHIITAAHCLRNQRHRYWSNSNFVVYLGLHNLTEYEKLHSKETKVTKILIHPGYNEETYEADIAILVIEPTTFNEYISPVCLWNRGISLKPLIGHFGTVVGWGMNRSSQNILAEPEVFHLPIVDQVECLRSRKEFLYITSERTLCAGLRSGTGPCNGESGSGLLILSYNYKNSLAWHLRGLISLSLVDRKKDTCDLKEYIVFTDVARFNTWINYIISNF